MVSTVVTTAAAESGAVFAWGDNYFGQAQAPAELNDVTAVAGGYSHSLALRSNGTVASWGSTTVPSNLTGVVAIAAGTLISLALKSDGTAVGWGDVGGPGNLTNIKAISCGFQHGLTLLSNGTVLAWGVNNAGQISVPNGLTNVIAISAGTYHSLALKGDGTVIGWGRNDFGQCNPPAGLSNVVAIGGGNYHSTALKSDGTVVGWGANWAFSEIANQNQPPPGLSNVVAIAVGAYHNLALRQDGTLVAWGWSGYGVNTIPQGISGVVTMSASLGHNVIVTKAPIITQQPQDTSVSLGAPATFSVAGYGNLPWTFQWYFNGLPLISQTNSQLTLTNVQHQDAGNYFVVISNVTAAVTSHVAILSVVDSPSIAPIISQLAIAGDDAQLTANAFGATPLDFRWSFSGSVLSNGRNNVLQLTNVQPADTGTHALSVSNAFGVAQAYPYLVVAPKRSVFAWGSDGFGQSTIPSGLNNLVAVSAGDEHNVGLHANGRVSVWGSSSMGQNSIPENLSNVVQVAAGRGFSAALRQNGTVSVWGWTFADISPPTDMTNVVAIAAGRHHALALLGNGSVRAWGGQTNVPPWVEGVTAIAAGWEHNLALRSNGVVIAWGGNSFGQSTVPALTNVISIAAGAYHSIALKTDGRIVCWGANGSGQASPPPGLSNVVEVAAGYLHSIARLGDGTVTTWGTSDWFLGGPASGLRGVRSLAAGLLHSVVLFDWPVFVQQPEPLVLLQGTSGILTATVTSQAPHTLQWQLNGTNLAGETNAFLIRSNVTASVDGVYRLVASNRYGVTLSDGVRLQVIVPPEILVQPQDIDVAIRGNATFTVGTSGSFPLSFQWFHGTNLIPDATGPALNLFEVTESSAGFYSVSVSNAAGMVVSRPTQLRLHFPPQIVAQPQSAAVRAGSTLAVSVTASGEAPFEYQWRFNGVPLANATTATFAIPVVQSAHQGMYSARVQNPWGAVESAPAVITVTNDLTDAVNNYNSWDTGGANAWFAQTNHTHDGISAAQSGAINHSEETWMETIFTGPGTLKFWWKVSSEEHYDRLSVRVWGEEARNISGEVEWHGELLEIPPGDTLVRFVYSKDDTLSEGRDAGWVDEIEFIPEEPPTIVTQPQSISVVPGESAVFKVTANGVPDPTYQWFLNNEIIADATAASYKISRAQVTNAGYYYVVVQNRQGETISDAAELVVRAPPQFARSPKSQIGFPAGTVIFDSKVDGSGPLVYQWFFNDSAIMNATNRTLPVSDLIVANEGTYYLRVSNSFGSTQTPLVTLAVATNSTIIDFDDRPAPCLLYQAFTLGTEYTHLGVTFSGAFEYNGAAVVNQCGIPGITGYSGSNFMGFVPPGQGTTADDKFSWTPIVFFFDAPVTAVQIRAGGWSTAGISLDAYNEADTLVAQTAPPMIRRRMQPINVSGPGIVKVVLNADSTVFWIADDLQFTTAEPLEARPPSLSVRRQGDQIRLLWPVYVDGFTLQSTTNMGSGLWHHVPMAGATNGVHRSVVLPLTNETQFFRLIRE